MCCRDEVSPDTEKREKREWREVELSSCEVYFTHAHTCIHVHCTLYIHDCACTIDDVIGSDMVDDD